MELTTLDWIIVGIFFLIVLTIGLVASRTAGKDMNQFFLGGRGMLGGCWGYRWWLVLFQRIPLIWLQEWFARMELLKTGPGGLF